MKKVLCFVAILIVSVSLAVLAGGQKEPTGGAVSAESTAGPIEISVFAPQGAMQELETNWFTQHVEERFNIRFAWQTTTWDATSASEKRKISLASGDYPDLYLLIPWVDHFAQAELQRYGQQGVIIPLNDLLEQYGPNVRKAMDERPYYRAMITAPDGNIYGVAQLIECYHCSYESKLWMNTQWLSELNLSMPKTTAEFRRVLEAFKTQDPNGNGQADEVPLSGSITLPHESPIHFVINAFIYDDGRSYLLLDNDKVDIAANKPGWREGLSYLHGLFQDGLIDPGAFTQNQDAFQQLGDNAGAMILGAGAGMHPAIFLSDAERLWADVYNPVPPLTGPRGVQYAAYNYPSAPGGDFVLTNKASEEAQVAAVKLLDYMFTTEGQIAAYFGQEGVDWRKPEPGEEGIGGVTPLVKEFPWRDDPPNNWWKPLGQYYQPIEFRNSWVHGTDVYDSSGYERRLAQATDLYKGKTPDEVFPHWSIWIDPSVVDEVAMLKTNITNYIEQNALQFITGDKSFTDDWNSYVQGLERLGLSKYLQIMQDAYNVYKNSVGE